MPGAGPHSYATVSIRFTKDERIATVRAPITLRNFVNGPAGHERSQLTLSRFLAGEFGLKNFCYLNLSEIRLEAQADHQASWQTFATYIDSVESRCDIQVDVLQ